MALKHHPEYGQIEHELACGVAVRAIAEKFGVPLHAVYRLREKLRMGQRRKVGAEVERDLAMQRMRLLDCQTRALEAGDVARATTAADLIQQNLQMVMALHALAPRALDSRP